MAKYGLKDKVIEDIREVLTAFPEVEEAILYGSRAKGNYKPGSDIDLTLKGDRINLSLINKISVKIDDLLLPYIVELSQYKNITNPDLINHINRVGLSFYRKKTDSTNQPPYYLMFL